jgi:hypothetical protein
MDSCQIGPLFLCDNDWNEHVLHMHYAVNVELHKAVTEGCRDECSRACDSF